MRKAFFLACALTALLITWYSCQKTADNPAPIDPTEIKVTASLRGRVTDENSRPVSGATVKAGGTTVTTDVNGQFRFDNIQLSKNAGFVTVEKTGYLKGSRTIFTNTNALNAVEIQLIPKVTRGTFTASAGSTITIGGGSTVFFPTDAVINTATNTAYTGTVTVSGVWLNPTDPNLHLIMPGNLTGINTEGAQQQLKTFGMMAVELEGSGGEKLNLAPNKGATLKMPIPAALQASAPASIPLWYFNETKGLWVEEGSATKQGNEYIGTVTHFSFWNCDVPANFVQLKLVLKDQATQPLRFYKVKLTANNTDTYGYTDSSGVVRGAVPLNTPIAMEVYNTCNTSIHTQNIGPYTQSTEEIVTITTAPSASVTLTGTIVNCSNAPITNGFAEINMDGVIYRALANSSGVYTITINKCAVGTSAPRITGVDIGANQAGGDTVILNVTSGNYNVPAVRACGTSVAQFIIYNLTGSTVAFGPPVDSVLLRVVGNVLTVLAFSRQQTQNYQSTSFSATGATATGTYPLSNMQVYRGSSVYAIQNGPMDVTISEFGNPGQYVAGIFSGNLRDSVAGGSATISVNASFRIKRAN